MGFDQKLIIKDYFMNRTNLVFRPKDMSLNNNKVKKKLKIDLGDIKDNIFDYYSIYKKKR